MAKFSKNYIVVAQNASGRNLNVPVYTFEGSMPGPTVYIQSSIHGAEVQGNTVIYHILKSLQSEPLKGKVVLVPNCNPVGSNLKSGEYTLGRFDPINGTNWNRGYYFDGDLVRKFSETISAEESISSIKRRFRELMKQRIEAKLNDDWGVGLAQRLNLKLQQIALDADIVIDLHNGPTATRHMYVPEFAKEAATLFNIPHVILIPNKFAGALDEATFCPWWTLQEILENRFDRQIDFQIEAFTLEMGSQEVINFEEGLEDAKGVLAYLNTRGSFDGSLFRPSQMSRIAVYLKDYKIMYSNFGGMVEYLAKPGQKIKQGKVMARVLNIDELDNERATHEVVAPCDLIPILHFPSASVFGGTQLYKCFTQYFDI